MKLTHEQSIRDFDYPHDVAFRPTEVGRLESRKPGLTVLAVDPASPLFAYVRPGFVLRKINEEPVRDTIDFHFKMAEPELNLLFESEKGDEILFEFDDISIEALGVTFDHGRIRTCKNDCIFCFIKQQPKGMRRSLYVKDEDYRYSFTHGNFITLSNTTDADIARIIEQRLSPLYISVHTTNDTLRRCMLKNELLYPVLPRIQELIAGGITIHAQVVACPGINDKGELSRTIEDLRALYPGVETLAIAPVGLTKYRDNLAEIGLYSAATAAAEVDVIEAYQKKFFAEIGTRFVWPTDEFYTISGRSFPSLSSYESLSQFENGIGMCRSFITDFNRKKRILKKKIAENSHRGTFVALTGKSAYPWFSAELVPQVRELGMPFHLHCVENKFWGGTVTISGLLTGQDLLEAGRQASEAGDTVLLPPNCLNNDDLFLDNMPLGEFVEKLGRRVIVGSYDLAATLREALDRGPQVRRRAIYS